MNISDDIIVALATPPGKSGVAVIRISGSNAIDVLPHIGVSPPLTPRYAYYKRLSHPHNEALIDNVLLLYFKAPHSFTGEDVIEIHCHGGSAVIQEIIALLLAIPNTRHAQAGEFTRRALEYGKMDLVEVEALADLIDAETRCQKDQWLCRRPSRQHVRWCQGRFA